jgi:hypothetical protein
VLKIAGLSLKIKGAGRMKLIVKVKFWLPMKVYRGVEVQLQPFLTSALEGS